MAAQRLALQLRSGQASWLEEEQISKELDDANCALICEALGEAVNVTNYKNRSGMSTSGELRFSCSHESLLSPADRAFPLPGRKGVYLVWTDATTPPCRFHPLDLSKEISSSFSINLTL